MASDILVAMSCSELYEVNIDCSMPKAVLHHCEERFRYKLETAVASEKHVTFRVRPTGASCRQASSIANEVRAALYAVGGPAEAYVTVRHVVD